MKIGIFQGPAFLSSFFIMRYKSFDKKVFIYIFIIGRLLIKNKIRIVSMSSVSKILTLVVTETRNGVIELATF